MPANSTTRILAVIDALVRAPDGSVGVRELAGQLRMSRSATHRILADLSDLGVARTLDGGRYEKTAEVSAWGYFLAHRHPVLTSARPIMEELRDRVQEAVHLLAATPTPATGVWIATAEAPHPVQHTVERGAASPVVQGAAGKALLSAYDKEVSDQVLEELAKESPDKARRLGTELATIRRRGYAVSESELLPDTTGIAAAFHRWGTVAGSLTISMPAYRHDAADDERRGHLVMEAAERLTENLAALDEAV